EWLRVTAFHRPCSIHLGSGYAEQLGKRAVGERPAPRRARLDVWTPAGRRALRVTEHRTVAVEDALCRTQLGGEPVAQPCLDDVVPLRHEVGLDAAPDQVVVGAAAKVGPIVLEPAGLRGLEEVVALAAPFLAPEVGAVLGPAADGVRRVPIRA